MRVLGAPTIKAYDLCDALIALEGSHRLQAAAELDLQPEWEYVHEEDVIEHDIPDLPNPMTVSVDWWERQSDIGHMPRGGAW